MRLTRIITCDLQSTANRVRSSHALKPTNVLLFPIRRKAHLFFSDSAFQLGISFCVSANIRSKHAVAQNKTHEISIRKFE